MKLVVTGALGHLGSRFLHDLRPGRYSEVLLLDNFATQRYASLFHLPEGVPFRFVEQDILRGDLRPHFESAHAVIHLAAITDVSASFEDPGSVEEVNGAGTSRVARACVETGARLFFPSSTSVYTASGGTVDEACTDFDTRIQTPYAAGKSRTEQELRRLGETEGLRFVCCRLGTLFGVSPGMRFHTAVNRFAWQACLGQPLSVWRTALEQRRPYLDVKDAARALEFLVREDLFDGAVYNVLTLNATVGSILEVLRTRVPDLRVDLVDARAMNALSFDVSAEKLRRAGFEFQGSLEKGVRETLELLNGIRRGG